MQGFGCIFYSENVEIKLLSIAFKHANLCKRLSYRLNFVKIAVIFFMIGLFFLIFYFNLRVSIVSARHTAQKMKFSIKDFFSKCGQIRSFLQICSHLLKKFLMENIIFCAVTIDSQFMFQTKQINKHIWH